jgi:hypothetical protein
MTTEQTTIILGDEHDDKLRSALRAVLSENNAVGLAFSRGVGGSQELETLRVRLGDDLIVIEAETFVGLSMIGRQAVVERLAQQVRARLGRSQR